MKRPGYGAVDCQPAESVFAGTRSLSGCSEPRGAHPAGLTSPAASRRMAAASRRCVLIRVSRETFPWSGACIPQQDAAGRGRVRSGGTNLRQRSRAARSIGLESLPGPHVGQDRGDRGLVPAIRRRRAVQLPMSCRPVASRVRRPGEGGGGLVAPPGSAAHSSAGQPFRGGSPLGRFVTFPPPISSSVLSRTDARFIESTVGDVHRQVGTEAPTPLGT